MLCVFLLFLIHQGVGGADLPVWAAYGRAERAGATDATRSAHLWYSSISTASTRLTICPLCGCRNPDSPTGGDTIIVFCVGPGLRWLCVFSAFVVQVCSLTGYKIYATWTQDDICNNCLVIIRSVVRAQLEAPGPEAKYEPQIANVTDKELNCSMVLVVA